ncbi:amidase domain-containing protein [Bacillota bacterium Lsc_1132]
MFKQLQDLFEKRVNHYVSEPRNFDSLYPKAEKKKESLAKRSAEIVKVKATGKSLGEVVEGEITRAKYAAQFQYLIKQNGHLYLEEEIEERVARFYKDELISDDEINPFADRKLPEDMPVFAEGSGDERLSYQYNRLKAVQYAERWWNSYNPAYKKFEVDCTNFISQCLHEGGAPMNGYPNRSKGWWLMNHNWSYSWAVANSLRLYLSTSRVGLRAREVSSPDQLSLGDVICYDFQGDGRFDHNTIVTGKDAYGMPLVNAHTYNSRMRYWAYEDSSAYTPNIKYKFFAIYDGQ